MKKLIPILFCLILLFSCDNNPQPNGNLTVKLASSKELQEGLYLNDIKERDHIAKIEVTIKSTFETSASTKTGTVENGIVTFTDLALGTYNLVGKAYNSDGVVIASGESSAYIKNGNNTAVLDINKLEGSGNFEFRIVYQYYGIPEDQLDIRYSVTDSNGNEIENSNFTNSLDTGVQRVISGTLPSGSYIFSAKVYVDGILVDGFIQAFRAIPGCTSGTRFTIKGRPATTNTSGITVTNSTSQKMECVVKESSRTNNQVTLTSIITELPDGLTKNDLSYQWYKNAEIMEGETGAELVVTDDSSKIQYSLIVKTNKIGSWASDFIYI